MQSELKQLKLLTKLVIALAFLSNKFLAFCTTLLTDTSNKLLMCYAIKVACENIYLHQYKCFPKILGVEMQLWVKNKKCVVLV